MPWFVVDDSAHSHPKIVKAGNAAMGLWMRCGAYAAQHLTDGVVPGPIASMYGTTPQATKLVKLGLWHTVGHACARCPQPPSGDYFMHDYLAYNPTRRQVLDKRERAAEKKRRQRGQAGPAQGSPEGNRRGFASESETNRERIEDESSSIHRPLSDDSAGQEGVSPGDSLGTRVRAFPSPPLPSKEPVADVGGESAGSSALAAQQPEGCPAPIDNDGFALTDSMRRWAAATFPSLDVDYETAQFVSHFRGEGTRRRSWPDEWQKWMRRSAKYASERRQAAAGNVVPLASRRPSTTDQRVQAALDLAAEFRALEGTDQ